MPNSKAVDPEILEAALIGLRHQSDQLDVKIAEIRQMLGIPAPRITSGAESPQRHVFSSAARRKMAEAQKKRWRAYRQAKAEPVIEAKESRKKSTISVTAKKLIGKGAYKGGANVKTKKTSATKVQESSIAKKSVAKKSVPAQYISKRGVQKKSVTKQPVLTKRLEQKTEKRVQAKKAAPTRPLVEARKAMPTRPASKAVVVKKSVTKKPALKKRVKQKLGMVVEAKKAALTNPVSKSDEQNLVTVVEEMAPETSIS